MIFPRAELWAALAFIVSVAASPLEKRVSGVLIGFRTVSAKQALIYQNAGNTLVWGKPENSIQIGDGTYMSPIVGDWDGKVDGWYCAVLADSGPWDLVNKAWVPEADGCTPLWWGGGIPNIPAYLTGIGGSGFTMANTVLLSKIFRMPKLQLALPRELHGANGGLSIVTQCAAKSDTAGVAALAAYGTVDWSRWLNVKGTVQTVYDE